MPKFNVEIKLTVKALFTEQPILEVEAESREVAEECVREFLDKFKNACEEPANLNSAFVDSLDFGLGDCETVEIDTLDVLSIEEEK